MNLRPLHLATPLFAALVAGGNVASATTFTYSSYNVTNEQNISILTPNSISGGAGQIELIGSLSDAGQDILAWCLDIYNFLDSSGSYQVGPLTTAGSGHGNPFLTNGQIGEIGSLIEHGNSIINSSSDVSAAIQVAIWNVEYGSSFTYTGLSNGVTSLANTYVTDVQTGSWDVPDYNVSLLTGSDTQDLAFVTPLPSTWTLMLIGCAALDLFAYRGTKKRSRTLAAF